jgi:flagellar motor switch protein FliM
MLMSDVQPYAFGHQVSEPAAAISGLEKLGDRLAKRLRGLIEPYSGGRPIVTAKPLDNTMFMMWDACVPTFVSLSLYRLHPIKGTVTLRIDAELISLLVDRFYGGHGPRGANERREFTPTEGRLVARLSEQMIAALVDCWAEIAPIEPVLMARESNVTLAEIMPADAAVVVQAFEINLGDKDRRLIEIIYPRDGFGAFEAHGAEKPASRRMESGVPIDPVWQARLGDRLDHVRLPARTVLARPNLKISELVALQPGDVIPINIARHLPLLIGERVFAHGSIGEQDGSAAFMIEKLA